jgi:hypothetical protein
VARTALLAGAVVLAVAAACSTQAQLAGSGAQCFAATDCQEGLVCIPQKGGTSICSNDLSMIQTVEDAAAGDAAPMPTGDGATGDDGAAMPDSGTTTDSGSPDTGSTPDTGGSPDTSAPDTSAPPDSSTTTDASMPDDAPAD